MVPIAAHQILDHKGEVTFAKSFAPLCTNRMPGLSVWPSAQCQSERDLSLVVNDIRGYESVVTIAQQRNRIDHDSIGRHRKYAAALTRDDCASNCSSTTVSVQTVRFVSSVCSTRVVHNSTRSRDAHALWLGAAVPAPSTDGRKSRLDKCRARPCPKIP